MTSADGPPCPRETCPNGALDTPAVNDALAADDEHDYFCPRCGLLFVDGEV